MGWDAANRADDGLRTTSPRIFDKVSEVAAPIFADPGHRFSPTQVTMGSALILAAMGAYGLSPLSERELDSATLAKPSSPG